jgi:hypothetical protein
VSADTPAPPRTYLRRTRMINFVTSQTLTISQVTYSVCIDQWNAASSAATFMCLKFRENGYQWRLFVVPNKAEFRCDADTSLAFGNFRCEAFSWLYQNYLR